MSRGGSIGAHRSTGGEWYRTATTALDPLLGPLDRLRAALLGLLAPLVRPFIRNRELRVLALALVVMGVSLAGTVVMPFWMLALGPLIWGVPHVLSDVRYLVVQPGHHRNLRLALGVGLPIAAAGLGGGLVAGFVAVGAVFALVSCPWWKRLIGWSIAAAGLSASLWWGYAADLVFAHVHNVIAVLLWWRWRPRTGWLHAAPLYLFAACSAVLALGVLDPTIAQLSNWTGSLAGLDTAYFLSTLVPAGMDSAMGTRLILLFAFAQSVHYGIWLRMMPEEARPQPTPRTFRATWRALLTDFGRWPLLMTALIATAIVGWAIFDLASARLGYLRLAGFHGHLELAAAALLFARGRAST